MLSAKSYARCSVILAAVLAAISASAETPAKRVPPIETERDGTVHVPAFQMPMSSYMSEEAKRSFVSSVFEPPALDRTSIATYRQTMDKYFYESRLEKAKAKYPVVLTEDKIGGVRVDRIVPKAGIAPANKNRILINLHGGGFRIGAGMGALVESIPVAGTAQIEVISVDYRQGPEYKFPAASEDVAAVYREVLKRYKPENIGIYGCSAGGMLTGMAMAWFQKEKLPRPGAIGIYCAPASGVLGGESRYTTATLDPFFMAPPPPASPNPPVLPGDYLSDADMKDPLVSPDVSPTVLAQFPPTLIITGTRAMEMSSAIQTHRLLVKAGVEADLHIWDGMWHGFFYDVALPESLEAYNVMAKFFDKHLGR